MLECGNCWDRDWGPSLDIMQDQMGSRQRVRQESGILFHPGICGSFPVSPGALSPTLATDRDLGTHGDLKEHQIYLLSYF